MVRRIGVQTDITEMVRAREELKKLALVASRTNSSVIIADQDLQIEWVNDGFTRLMGYSLEEAAGKKPSKLLHKHNSDKTAFLELEGKLMQGQPVSFEVLNVKKDGSEVWINAEITPVFDENGKLSKFIEVQTDITALKASEQELKKLALVASGTDNGVLITDALGLTEWVNEGFTRITGYTLQDLAGKEPGAVLRGPGTDQATVDKVYDHIKRGVSFSAELLNYKKSGEKYWVSMDVNAVHDDHGSITHFISMQRDVTYKKEAEATLLKMTEDLYTRNSDLQQFTYIVSHNLRAPVANALGLASLMAKTDKTSRAYDLSLEHLKTSLVRMDTVLKDVNSILSIREAQPVLTEERVVLVEVIRQVTEYLQEPLFRLKAVVSVDADESFVVCSNKAYLFSVFYNLMTNAIKYRSHERPLKIEVQHLTGSEGYSVVTFADNGIGIDMHQAEGNIFGLYKRFHKDIEGRGMGLFLVKTHVEAMGGSIKVESEIGAGTKFRQYLINCVNGGSGASSDLFY